MPTRLVVDLIDRLDPQLVVYYCIANFGQLTSQPRAIAKSERMLLDRADVVVAASLYGEVYVTEDAGDSWRKLAKEFGEVRAVAVTPG